MADIEESSTPPEGTGTQAVTEAASAAASKSKAVFAEVQETVSRLASHKGVTSVLILNHAGDILTQTGKGAVGNPKLLKKTLESAAHYIHSMPSDENEENSNVEKDDTCDDKASGPFDELSFIRIRSKKEEILVAPKNQYVLVVIQDPTLAPL